MIKRNIIYSAWLVLLLSACQESQPSATSIIEKAFNAAGSDIATNALIRFDFRDRSYSIEREKGLFDMRRYTYINEDSTWMDQYHNYGFKRFLNDSMVSIPDSMAAKYQASVNSVIYFFSLPFGLKDPAVNALEIGEITIEDKAYHKLEVRFDEQGGGEDHEDIFIYWINKDTYFIDYLAYAYKTDGGGMRFRKAINPRTIEGIRFVDYINYKPTQENSDVRTLDEAYLNNRLEVLSKIENDGIEVRLNAEP